MPLLSLNFGINTTRGVYLDDKKELSSYVFKYPYSKDLYEHFYKEQAFYSDVVNFFIKQFGINKSSCPIIATGFPSVPSIGRPFSSIVLLDQLVKKIEKYHVVSVTDRSVFRQNTYVSHNDIKNLQYGPKEKNYLLNLSLYSNTVPEKPSEYNLLLANVWNIFQTLDEVKTDSKTQPLLLKPTLFMGDIFDTVNKEFEKIAYLYILSFITTPGFHFVSLDKHSDLVHLAHIKQFNDELGSYFDEFSPKNLGTLLNSPGDTTCLLQNETGNNQLLEIKAGRLVFLPLNEFTSSKIVAKGKYIGSVDRTIKGGKLGFIIDTRHKNDKKTYDYNLLQMDINSNLKGINEIYGRI